MSPREIIVCSALLVACAESGPIGAAPGAEHARGAAAHAAEPPLEQSAKQCGDCHREHADEHRASAHARAFVNPLFQREWRQEQSAFCIRCHAPRAASPEDARDTLRAGVDCESCHVRDGVVRAVRVSGDAPHATREDASLATVEACASCHQVDFPDIPGQPLQDTVAEWRAAGEPGGACQTCHMPRRGDHHLHHAPGGHDPEMLRRAVSIEARAEPDGWDTRVVVRLRGTGAGHAVPTGDVFRRLVVRAWRDDRPEEARAIELGRHFTARRERPWVPLRDDRVPAGGVREVSLRVLGRPAHVRWAVAMASLPAADAARSGLFAPTLQRTFASGVLAVPPR